MYLAGKGKEVDFNTEFEAANRWRQPHVKIKQTNKQKFQNRKNITDFYFQLALFNVSNFSIA